jgi:hypothetical protein
VKLSLFVERGGFRKILSEGYIIEVVEINIWHLNLIIVVSFDGVGESFMNVKNWDGSWDFPRYLQSFSIIRKKEHLLRQKSSDLRLFRSCH